MSGTVLMHDGVRRAPVPTAAILWADYRAKHGGDAYAALHDLRLVRKSVGRCRVVEDAIRHGLGALGRTPGDA